MATRYVSPTGATPGGYTAYYTNFSTAWNACLTGDEIILEKVTNHVTTTGSHQKNGISIAIRNELNDNDYANCAIQVADATTFYFHNTAAAASLELKVKGVTFIGPSTGVTTKYTDNVSTALWKFTATHNHVSILFDYVRICYMERSLATHSQGGVVWFGPSAGTDNIGIFRNCKFDHLYGAAITDPDQTISDGLVRRTWSVFDYTVHFEDCTFEDLGEKAGRTGAGWVSSVGVVNTEVVFRRCSWARVYNENAANLNANAPDGGAFYCYNNNTTTTAKTFLYDCTFTDMAAGKGGGLWVGVNGHLYAERCTFTNTYSGGTSFGGGAAGRGGVTDSTFLGWSTYKSCTFTNCTTAGAGGALRNVGFNGRLIVDGCTFSGCGSALNGEDIFCENHASAFITELPIISNCTFNDTGVRVYGNLSNAIGAISGCVAADGLAAYSAGGAAITPWG